MKKVLSYMLIMLGIAAIAVASYRPLMVGIWEYDKKHACEYRWYLRYICPWGDLVHLSNMDGIARFREEKLYTYEKAPCINNGNIALFVFGDSYTRDIPDSVFCNVGSYHHARITGKFDFQPEPGKKNVLVLEMTERYIRSILHVTEDFSQAPPENSFAAGGGDGPKSYSAFINKNLDFLLLGYNCMNSIRFAKAGMNFHLFGRGSGNAVISDDGNYLFMHATVRRKGIFSSYEPLHDTEIYYLGAKLNRIYVHFRNAGFDEVYLSMIPSPASILQPDGYNMLIPSLQQFPGLKIPIIDVYTPFRTDAQPVRFYRMGDTHWNNTGMHMWISLVNDRLKKQ